MKIIKIFITLIISLSITYSSLISVFALNPDSQMHNHFIYSNDGVPLKSPAAFIPFKYVDNSVFNLSVPPEIYDVSVFSEERIFITDRANNSIIILNKNLDVEKIMDTFYDGDAQYNLKAPEGVFVADIDNIYIADTGNNRILLTDYYGNIKRIFADPGIVVLQEKVTFLPSKIVVDNAGRIYVVAKNVNRGIVELDNDGNFTGFLGAPRVSFNLVEYLWKRFSTEAQLARMVTYVPTEYNNVAIDSTGFIYATISTLNPAEFTKSILSKDKSGTITPIRKLNFRGTDVLSRAGDFAPVGDIFKCGTELPSVIVDVALNDNGWYSLLDSRRSRIFTYDMDGNLLYIFGGYGNQFGKMQDASSIDYLGDNILVTDRSQGRLTMFKITQYGQCINDAVRLNHTGNYQESAIKWNEALELNSNLYVAYVGIGKNLYREGKYVDSMKYLEIANEKIYYSKAFKLHRKDVLSGFFNVIGSIVVILVIGAFVLMYNSKRKLRKGKKL